MTHSVFITGANRGLGFEFSKQYAEDGWKVFATCRDPKKARKLIKLSQSLPNISIIKFEVTSETDLKQLARKLKNKPIDLLINSAAILNSKENQLQNVTKKSLIDSFLVNTVSPFLITKALLPNIKLSKLKTVVALSSILASQTENLSGIWNNFPYKTSKAALNMLMSSLTNDPNFNRIKILLIDPGWAKTDMGGKNATLYPTESVSGMRAVIHKNKLKRAFINHQGKINPW